MFTLAFTGCLAYETGRHNFCNILVHTYLVKPYKFRTLRSQDRIAVRMVEDAEASGRIKVSQTAIVQKSPALSSRGVPLDLFLFNLYLCNGSAHWTSLAETNGGDKSLLNLPSHAVLLVFFVENKRYYSWSLRVMDWPLGGRRQRRRKLVFCLLRVII